MADAIDIAALNAALGAYYRENNTEILRSSLVNLESPMHFKHVAGLVDEYPLIERKTTDVVQPYQDAWTPKNDVVDHGVRILKVRKQKVDLEIKPDELRQSWYGYLSKNSSKPEDFPFERFVWEDLIARINSNIEMKMIWSGIYAAPTPGTPGNPQDGMDGIKKKIADEIIGGGLVPVGTGPITQTVTVDAFEQTFDAVPDAIKEEPLLAFCSSTMSRWYNKDYRDQFGSNTNYNEFKRAMLDGTNCQIVPIKGLAGSQRIVICKPDNIHYGYNLVGEHDQLRTQINRRVIDVLGDFMLGVEIALLDEMVVNDQA